MHDNIHASKLSGFVISCIEMHWGGGMSFQCSIHLVCAKLHAGNNYAIFTILVVNTWQLTSEPSIQACVHVHNINKHIAAQIVHMYVQDLKN